MDLSKLSGNSGSFYLSPSKEELQKHKLTKEQIATYLKNGFLVVDEPVLDEKVCDAFLKDYESIINFPEDSPQRKLFYEFHSNQTKDPSNVLFHALGHWRTTKLFHDLIYHPALTVPSSQLMSDDDNPVTVRFWHDQLFAKSASHGGVVAWHQDYSYWTRTKPMRHMTVHIALDEETVENGCIHYIKESHNWTRDGKPLPVTDYDFKDMESIKTILTEEEEKAFQPTPCLLKKGQAVFHHPLAVHGSFNNKSDKPRRAAVVNYFADGVISDINNPHLDGTDVIPKGEKMQGQFFPIVLNAEDLGV